MGLRTSKCECTCPISQPPTIVGLISFASLLDFFCRRNPSLIGSQKSIVHWSCRCLQLGSDMHTLPLYTAHGSDPGHGPLVIFTLCLISGPCRSRRARCKWRCLVLSFSRFAVRTQMLPSLCFCMWARLVLEPACLCRFGLKKRSSRQMFSCASAQPFKAFSAALLSVPDPPFYFRLPRGFALRRPELLQPRRRTISWPPLFVRHGRIGLRLLFIEPIWIARPCLIRPSFVRLIPSVYFSIRCVCL